MGKLQHNIGCTFCKHIFMQNFTDAKKYYAKITEENEKFIKTKYEARTEKELTVLKRFFLESDVKQEKSKYLDVILYTKDQIQRENEAMGNEDGNKDIDYEWGIISIKAQDTDEVFFMEPFTALRNALGKEEGGSGIPLDKEKYNKSVEFWQDHAMVI